MKVDVDLYRRIPAVDELLRQPGIMALVVRDGQAAVADSARAVLARVRGEIAAGNLDGEGLARAMEGISSAVEVELRQSLGFSLRSVINATGVILHTNLG